MKHTAEDIERLIKPYGFTLSDLPVPVYDEETEHYNSAYEDKDHKIAWIKARIFGCSDVLLNTTTLSDFVCHQSDVIELLCMALEASNEKVRELLNKEEVEFGMTRGRAMMIFQDINNSEYDDEEKEKAINVVLNSKDMQCIDKEYFIAVMKWMYDLMEIYL